MLPRLEFDYWYKYIVCIFSMHLNIPEMLHFAMDSIELRGGFLDECAQRTHRHSE